MGTFPCVCVSVCLYVRTCTRTCMHSHQPVVWRCSVSCPGLQFLHCTQLDWVKSPADIPASQRGLSMFVDGLAVANHLRENNPAAYHILSSTPVTFSIRFKEVGCYFQLTVISKLEIITECITAVFTVQLAGRMCRPLWMRATP